MYIREYLRAASMLNHRAEATAGTPNTTTTKHRSSAKRDQLNNQVHPQ